MRRNSVFDPALKAVCNTVVDFCACGAWSGMTDCPRRKRWESVTKIDWNERIFALIGWVAIWILKLIDMNSNNSHSFARRPFLFRSLSTFSPLFGHQQVLQGNSFRTFGRQSISVLRCRHVWSQIPSRSVAGRLHSSLPMLRTCAARQ